MKKTDEKVNVEGRDAEGMDVSKGQGVAEDLASEVADQTLSEVDRDHLVDGRARLDRRLEDPEFRDAFEAEQERARLSSEV